MISLFRSSESGRVVAGSNHRDPTASSMREKVTVCASAAAAAISKMITVLAMHDQFARFMCASRVRCAVVQCGDPAQGSMVVENTAHVRILHLDRM
jgi:hypothetical protein